MVVPLVEIAFFVVIGNAIGLWPTLAGVLVTAIIGSVVLRYQGLALFREIQETTARGLLPARALADGMMIGIAGILLLTPGYFTDLMGLLLLVPAVRTAIYAFLKSRIQVVTPGMTGYGPPPEQRGTIDLEQESWRRR